MRFLAMLALAAWAGALATHGGLSAPMAGYHAFNEAFYLDLVTRYQQLGLLSPWHAVATEQSTALPRATSLLLLLPANPMVLGRMLSVAAAILTAAVVFSLGRRLYGTLAGLDWSRHSDGVDAGRGL